MTVNGTFAQVSTLATHIASSAWSMVGEYFIILILLAALFLFAWYIGHGSFVALLLAFYAAYAIYILFPYTSSLPTTPPLTAFLAHAGLYAVLVFIFFLILRRVIVSDFLHIGNFGLLILSFLGATFLVAVSSHVFVITSFYHFTPAISSLFPSEYFFWWFSGPAIGLLLFAH
jgi:hypothetical protein